ncbi:hypothetical protein M5K25_027091 [Dendrobium thyrsiflorum]|uniref:Transmembrane protein n=1 Tax=Dendrobium thyrsiflorum TaxID=117978 RepID=A0ABD0TYZ3_DENTH
MRIRVIQVNFWFLGQLKSNLIFKTDQKFKSGLDKKLRIFRFGSESGQNELRPLQIYIGNFFDRDFLGACFLSVTLDVNNHANSIYCLLFYYFSSMYFIKYFAVLIFDLRTLTVNKEVSDSKLIYIYLLVKHLMRPITITIIQYGPNKIINYGYSSQKQILLPHISQRDFLKLFSKAVRKLFQMKSLMIILIINYILNNMNLYNHNNYQCITRWKLEDSILTCPFGRQDHNQWVTEVRKTVFR